MLYIATIWHNCTSTTPQGSKGQLSVTPVELSTVPSRCKFNWSCSSASAGLTLEQITGCQYLTCDIEACIRWSSDICSLFTCICLHYGLKSTKCATIWFKWACWACFLTSQCWVSLHMSRGLPIRSLEKQPGVYENCCKTRHKENKLQVDENISWWAT